MKILGALLLAVLGRLPAAALREGGAGALSS